MKTEAFEGNTRDCNFEYFRVREGPNYFVSYYKHSSRLHYDPKDTWRTLGTAKFTDTGKALKEWCLLMDEQYSIPQRERWSDGYDSSRSGADGAESEARSGRVDTSFASEAMEEEESPTDNTKMVT